MKRELEMGALVEAPPRLPENSVVRLVDLDPGTGGLISVDETGFVNIYINARLSHDGRLRALRHELQHYYRGDLYSDTDIREVERLADGPRVKAIDGTTLSTTPPGFAAKGMKAVGQGLYRLTGANLSKAAADLARVRALLLDACHICDVARTAPGLPVPALAALAEGLGVHDIAFIAWHPEGSEIAAALRFCREDGARLHGALFYDRRGQLDNALAVLEAQAQRVTVDLRRRRGRLDISGITAVAEGMVERVY